MTEMETNRSTGAGERSAGASNAEGTVIDGPTVLDRERAADIRNHDL